MQIQQSLAALPQAYAVRPFRKETVHEGVALGGNFRNCLPHEVHVATAEHPEVEEGDHQIPRFERSLTFLQKTGIVRRDTLAELRFGQLNNVQMVSGSSGKARAVKKKIDAVDLGRNKNGLRIIVRDHDPGLRE